MRRLQDLEGIMNSIAVDIIILLVCVLCGAVVERLRRRPREKNVPSSIPRLGISVEVSS